MTLDFKEHLKNELLKRCRHNPGYSLRAFARSLGVDSSTLSKVINGKRPIGKKTISTLSLKLGLNQSQMNLYIRNRSNSSGNGDFNLLQDDVFAFISDWYHYAILELLRVDDFDFSIKTVASSLNISIHESKAAIERLERLKLISKVQNKFVLASEKNTNITPHISTHAQRHLQKQILENGAKAIDSVEYSMRNNTSLTFAVDTSKLPEAVELIKTFRRNMGDLMSRGKTRNEVYNLAIALYPISSIKLIKPKRKT